MSSTGAMIGGVLTILIIIYRRLATVDESPAKQPFPAHISPTTRWGVGLWRRRWERAGLLVYPSTHSRLAHERKSSPAE